MAKSKLVLKKSRHAGTVTLTPDRLIAYAYSASREALRLFYREIIGKCPPPLDGKGYMLPCLHRSGTYTSFPMTVTDGKLKIGCYHFSKRDSARIYIWAAMRAHRKSV